LNEAPFEQQLNSITIMNITGFTQDQKQALLDLLIIGMYADHNLASAEDKRIEQLLDTFSFASDYEREKFPDAAFTRARRQSDSPQTIRSYLTEIARHFPTREIRQRAYDVLDDLLTSDGASTRKRASSWQRAIFPSLSRAFRSMESILSHCLQLGLHLVRPGTVRWDGDRFTAGYAATEGVRRGGVRVTGADGQEAPAHLKARILADLEAKPTARKMKATFVRKEHKVFRSAAEAEAVRAASEPAPDSLEARIVALWEAREQERLRKGIRGELVRDAQNRVQEIKLDCEPACHVVFAYEEPANLPPPFPSRVRTFLEHAEARPNTPSSELVIHSVRLASEELGDDAFDPGPWLKPGSWVPAQLKPDGSTFIPNAADRRFVNEWVQKKHL
jgi:hypothetical protein